MIDLIDLQRAIKELTPRQKIFQVLRTELTLKGYWKTKKRGKGFSKGYDSRRNVTKL